MYPDKNWLLSVQMGLSVEDMVKSQIMIPQKSHLKLSTALTSQAYAVTMDELVKVAAHSGAINKKSGQNRIWNNLI